MGHDKLTSRLLVCVALVTLSLSACGSGGGDGQSNNIHSSGGGDDAGADANVGEDAGDGLPSTVTYYQHVKPILDGRCTRCHVDGGIAPFGLTTYAQAEAVSASMATQVTAKLMPPWLAGDECTEYKHDYSLTDRQIALIDKWIDQDTPEGDASNPADPLPDVGGGLSRVDLTLKMPQTYTPQESPDDYRCIPIEWPESEATYVTGFGIEPDQKEIVHHVIAYLAAPGLADAVTQKDAAEDGPGYTCFGGPGVGNQNPQSDQSATWLGSWAPGGQGHDLPDGTGIEVKPGSTIILQVHYNTLSADPAPDQTEMVVKLDSQVDNPAYYIPWTNPSWLGGDSMKIPAGSSDTTHSFGYDAASYLGTDLLIHDVGFHMHNLGSKGRLWINRSDGSEDCLLDIPRWDFDWQFGYRLASPTKLEIGDQLNIECTWDNSPSNQPVIDGQRQQPRDVTWGDGTTDEMCLGLLYVTLAP